LGVQAGLWVWRIEALEPVLQAPGCGFHRGDAYVVVHSTEVGGAARNEIASVIYLWVGGECSADERGCAAVKVMEVGAFLGGSAPQVREADGHESSGFLSLFRPCFEVLEGGAPSAFSSVDRDAFEPRLMQVKGKGKRCVVRSVGLSRGSLNSGDTFLLDLGRRVVVWCGSESHRWERAKALEVALGIRDGDRGGNAVVDVVEQGEEEGADGVRAFWAAMPEGEGPVASSAEGGADGEEGEGQGPGMLARAELYRVSDAAGGEPLCERVEISAKSFLRREDLDGDDCFVLDCGGEVFVWVGRGATEGESREASRCAERFLEDAGRPAWTRVTRLVEGAETALFKSKFQWPAAVAVQAPPPAPRRQGLAGAAAAHREEEVDVGALVTSPRAAREDDARVEVSEEEGVEVTVWMAVDGGTERVPAAEVGVFHSAESYVVQYTYPKGTDAKGHVVYFWLGRDAAASSKGTAALAVKALAEELGPGVPQVRCVQNAEPPHLLRLFGGQMLVKLGGKRVGKKGNKKKKRGKGGSGKGRRCDLYHVKGGDGAIRAVQVGECVASALNSSDCFLLAAHEEETVRVTVWYGKGASGREREVALALASRVGTLGSEVEEGEEGEAFWEGLGGRGEYPEGRPEEASHGGAGPRLFCCSDASGAFAVEEVPSPWGQEDLVGDDVMLLDGGGEVYVWVGAGANEAEKSGAVATADKYLEAVAQVDGRRVDASVCVVGQGGEPPSFTAFFVGWDPDWVDPMAEYTQRLEELASRDRLSPSKGQAEEAQGEVEDVLRAQLKALSPPSSADRRREVDAAVDKSLDSEVAARLAQRLAHLNGCLADVDEQVQKEDEPFVRKTWPYAKLKVTVPGQEPPPGVRAEERELSLSDAEFHEVMGMPRDAFLALPAWKRKDLKQKVHLF